MEYNLISFKANASDYVVFIGYLWCQVGLPKRACRFAKPFLLSPLNVTMYIFPSCHHELVEDYFFKPTERALCFLALRTRLLHTSVHT